MFAGESCPIEGRLRLADGDMLGGRLEVCLNNMWSTVCSSTFGLSTAVVVCSSLTSSIEGIYMIHQVCMHVIPITYTHI